MLAVLEGYTKVETFYLVCAVIGGICFVIRLALQFIGGADTDVDGDIGDVDVDADAGDSDMGFHVLSFQGLTAFFMMFGIVGLALLRETGWDELRATVGALAAGVASVWVVKKLFELAGALQSSGNVRWENAVGQKGQVYLHIPAGGSGQVQVPVQNQLLVCDAVAQDEGEIATGEQIEVISVSGNTLTVRKVQ